MRESGEWNSLDALTALENWVEGGIAPDSIIVNCGLGYSLKGRQSGQ